MVEIFEAGPLQSDEHKTAEFYIQKLEYQGAGNEFVGLSFAPYKPNMQAVESAIEAMRRLHTLWLNAGVVQACCEKVLLKCIM